MSSSRIYVVCRDDDGWGVMDGDGIFENRVPFRTKAEALEFRAALHQAHEDWNANLAYWSQSCFGE